MGCCGGGGKKKEGKKGRSEGERASLCRPPSSYYLWTRAAEPRRRGVGEHGDQLRPLPHVPRLLRPDGIIKPPREGERSVWAAEDPRSGRGLGVAGPGLRRRPVTRELWQGLAATWPAGGPAVSSRVDHFPACKTQGSPKSAYISKADSSG